MSFYLVTTKGSDIKSYIIETDEQENEFRVLFANENGTHKKVVDSFSMSWKNVQKECKYNISEPRKTIKELMEENFEMFL